MLSIKDLESILAKKRAENEHFANQFLTSLLLNLWSYNRDSTEQKWGKTYPPVMTNIAIENGHRNSELSH